MKTLIVILVLSLAAGAQTYTVLDYPGATGTVLRAINKNGAVIGYYLSGTVRNAFLRKPT